MGQKTSKVPPAPAPEPLIVVNREDYVLSPILYVTETYQNPRVTLHIAFYKPTKSLYFVAFNNPTVDDSIGIPSHLKDNQRFAIDDVIPGLDGHSVVVVHAKRGTNRNTTYLERLSNGMILKRYSCEQILNYTVAPKDFLNRRPFVPVGDPRYDALACLFVPPPQNVADTQNNERS
jgi:hypothetical protein